jgi:dipeptidase E
LLNEGKIVSGYAADNGAAAHFINDELNCAISSRSHAKVYQVDRVDDKVIEKEIETNYLGR